MSRSIRRVSLIVLLAPLVALALPASADEGPESSRIDVLEARVEQLETQLSAALEALAGGPAPVAPSAAVEAPAGEVAAAVPVVAATPPVGAAGDLGAALDTVKRHVRLGGLANLAYFDGQEDSFFHPDVYEVWDARLFVDAELGSDVRVDERTIVRNAGFSFEWDLVRIGKLEFTEVGDVYVDLQGLGGSPWANVQMGRFQIPVGESYLRYGKGYANKPFVSNTVGGPWYWDEGVRFYGASPSERFGYVGSITNSETPLNDLINSDKQYTLKLYGQPTEWLRLSVSGLMTGELGSSSRPANGALWLGEMWARAFGSSSSVPSYTNGAIVAPGPNELHDTWFAGADAVITPMDDIRLWLAYGYYDIDSTGPARYDRSLHYWIAELVVGGGLVSSKLRDFYVGVRANGLGTYDDDHGYLLDNRHRDTVGYNLSSLNAYSVVFGWKMLRHLTLRAEYTFQDLDLVSGVSSQIRRLADDANYFAIEFGVHF